MDSSRFSGSLSLPPLLTNGGEEAESTGEIPPIGPADRATKPSDPPSPRTTQNGLPSAEISMSDGGRDEESTARSPMSQERNQPIPDTSEHFPRPQDGVSGLGVLDTSDGRHGEGCSPLVHTDEQTTDLAGESGRERKGLNASVADPSGESGAEREELNANVADPSGESGAEREELNTSVADPSGENGTEREELNASVADPSGESGTEREGLTSSVEREECVSREEGLGIDRTTATDAGGSSPGQPFPSAELGDRTKVPGPPADGRGTPESPDDAKGMPESIDDSRRSTDDAKGMPESIDDSRGTLGSPADGRRTPESPDDGRGSPGSTELDAELESKETADIYSTMVSPQRAHRNLSPMNIASLEEEMEMVERTEEVKRRKQEYRSHLLRSAGVTLQGATAAPSDDTTLQNGGTVHSELTSDEAPHSSTAPLESVDIALQDGGTDSSGTSSDHGKREDGLTGEEKVGGGVEDRNLEEMSEILLDSDSDEDGRSVPPPVLRVENTKRALGKRVSFADEVRNIPAGMETMVCSD